MKIFDVHTAVFRGLNAVYFAPGDKVPHWAYDLVGDHCLRRVELRAEHGPELVNFDDDAAALLAAESEGLPPADEDADDDKGDGDAEDPAEPAADAASLDFTAPAKPKATRGRPAKKA